MFPLNIFKHLLYYYKKMSEIVIEHFSKVNEPDLRFDGNYYTVKGDRYKKNVKNLIISTTLHSGSFSRC
jgi:hypothetical protein